jgi:hypothetical protein
VGKRKGGGLTWMQSRAVLMIRGTLLLQASSNGLKYLSALTRPPGKGRASDSDLLCRMGGVHVSVCVCMCVSVCVHNIMCVCGCDVSNVCVCMCVCARVCM